ncbi:proactivator polypeptide-like 1 [Artibeus jamaicensis]|uniref:proactivator polypeptide-like 1 n=1 Tax=Artibeus jamaicensis TaxID=9417 RepID=UPI00235B14DD|nr:proactivator polypeptide-like 1 [Artibeus jamaicensis]
MFPTLLLLPSLLGASLASPIQGPRECAQGSAEWCRDLQAAMRCGAVGYCRSAVWSKPTARSLSCDLCLDVVAAGSNGLNPNATETDTLALVTRSCEWLPGQDSSVRCKEMTDAHSSAILDMLRGDPGSAPAQVCTALTLCQPLQRVLATPGPLSEEDTSEVVAPFMVSEPLSPNPLQIPEDTVCQDCVQLVARLQDAVGSNMSSLAEVTTQEQCKSLGPGLDLLCKNYILRFLTPAEHMLRVVLPEETCERGGFCEEMRGPATDAVPPLEPLSARERNEVLMKAGLTCDVCLQVVQELDQWLDSDSTEALIRRGLERVCSVMPTSIVRQCVTMVDTYSPALVQFVTKVPPEDVCKAIRLCGARRQARAIHEAYKATLPPLLDTQNQGHFCNGCRRLLGVSTQNLDRKNTQRNILKAFKGGCSILPLPYLIQCRRFVDEYEPVLIATLKEVMDPLSLCTKVGACHASRTPLLGTDQCVMGPSFWCSNQEAAEMCNAMEHCQRHLWGVAPFHSGEHA